MIAFIICFSLQEEAKRELESGDEFIEIEVTSPHKVGEGMSSFMAYKVITKTNLSYFKKQRPEVNRRFSDFLGLRDKLCEKYLQNGRIIPPCPDKSVIGMTKVKMSKEDEASVQSGDEKNCTTEYFVPCIGDSVPAVFLILFTQEVNHFISLPLKYQSFFCVVEFVEKRRAALERYLNRTAGHPNLRVDPDFRSASI